MSSRFSAANLLHNFFVSPCRTLSPFLVGIIGFRLDPVCITHKRRDETSEGRECRFMGISSGEIDSLVGLESIQL